MLECLLASGYVAVTSCTASDVDNITGLWYVIVDDFLSMFSVMMRVLLKLVFLGGVFIELAV